MVELVGDVPFAAWMGAQVQALAPDARAPLDDGCLGERFVPASGAGGAWSLLTDRWSLRESMRAAGLRTPEGVRVSSFESLCQWVLARRRFPLALKSVANGAMARGVLRVQGFKDLELAWDRLQKQCPGDALAEDWCDGVGHLELTLWNAGRTSVASQVGLMKSMVPRTAWRQFPGALPPARRGQLEPIVAWLRAAGLLAAVVPLRLDLVLQSDGIVLAALGGGWNRLEYYPATYGAVTGAPPVAQWLPAPGESMAAVNPRARFGRWQFWRVAPAKDEGRDESNTTDDNPEKPDYLKREMLHGPERPPWCPLLLRDGRWTAALIVADEARDLATRAAALANLYRLPRE